MVPIIWIFCSWCW